MQWRLSTQSHIEDVGIGGPVNRTHVRIQVDPQLVITALRHPPFRGRQIFVAQADRAICGANEGMTIRD